jgi:hypothetical protein
VAPAPPKDPPPPVQPLEPPDEVDDEPLHDDEEWVTEFESAPNWPNQWLT